MNQDLQKGQMAESATENNKAAGVEVRKWPFFRIRCSNRERNRQEHAGGEAKSHMYLRRKTFPEEG